MTTAFSWQNAISLCPASFCIPRPNLPVSPGVSWLPTVAFQSPIMKRISFLGVSSKGLVGLHRTVQLQLPQHYWLGHRLWLLRNWMVCLWNKQRSFCHFWDCIQVLHFRLFCWPWWLLHFFWGIPARSSRYNGHLSHLSSPPTPKKPQRHYSKFKNVATVSESDRVITIQVQTRPDGGCGRSGWPVSRLR